MITRLTVLTTAKNVEIFFLLFFSNWRIIRQFEKQNAHFEKKVFGEKDRFVLTIFPSAVHIILVHTYLPNYSLPRCLKL